MDKQRQDALEWLVHFAQMNLKEIRPGDKAKLLVEAEEYLYPMREIREFKESLTEYDPAIAQIENISKMFDDLEWVAELPKKISGKDWPKIIRLQDSIREEFRSFLADRPPDYKTRRPEIIYRDLSTNIFHPVKSIDYPIFHPTARFWMANMLGLIDWKSGKYRLSLFPFLQTHEEYIKIKIYKLLNGLSRSTIQLCPGCEKYFFNASLRKKRFCSSRCLWRINAEKRRKADPEAYKKYQRELMRDKYRIQEGLKPKKFYKKAMKGE